MHLDKYLLIITDSMQQHAAADTDTNHTRGGKLTRCMYVCMYVCRAALLNIAIHTCRHHTKGEFGGVALCDCHCHKCTSHTPAHTTACQLSQAVTPSAAVTPGNETTGEGEQVQVLLD